MFWDRVDKTPGFGPNGDCWKWTGGLQGNKMYGVAYMSITKRCTTAHRVAYFLVRGSLPLGLNICHRCDNGLCVNPDHLFAGTQKENLEDASLKGRMNVPHNCDQTGDKNNGVKISEDQAREVLYLFSKGMPQREIARQTGVRYPNVWCIVNSKSWTHLPRTGFDANCPALIADFVRS